MTRQTKYTLADLPAIDEFLTVLERRDYDSIPHFAEFAVEHNMRLDTWAWCLREIFKEERAKILSESSRGRRRRGNSHPTSLRTNGKARRAERPRGQE